MKGQRYKNPPITEVICEFQFESEAPWDLAVPGLIYEKVKQSFPKRRQRSIYEVSVETSRQGAQQQLKSINRAQFLVENEKALVEVGQVNESLISIHHFKPYPSWEEYFPLIKIGFDAYKIVNPIKVRRIGLRYINRIELPFQKVALKDYFNFRPYVGKELPKGIGSFIVGITIPLENYRDQLKLQLNSTTSKNKDIMACILDLDYFSVQSEKISIKTVLNWVEVAHDHTEEIFEGCITDKLREIFIEEKK